MGTAGISGLAILTPRDGGTAANVLAVGAPTGTIVVVHLGTCAAIDPTPVGLLGDIGAAGQLSTVIPVPYATVADGHHVLAFHPGLDLTTVLGCGQVPLVTATTVPVQPGGSAAPAPTSGAATSYESADFGFRIDWTAPWSRQSLEPVAGIDAVGLGNGRSEVIIAGDRVIDGDARTCVRDWESRVLGTLRDGSIGDLAPVTGADGKPIAGGDALRSVGAYQFRRLATDAAGRTIIERVECRHLSSDSVLEITLDVPSDAFASETAVVDALLGGLTVAGRVASASPGTGVETLPPAAPTATPAPVATPADTGCAGMDVWVPATLARLDQLKGIADDAASASNSGMDAYARQLATNSTAVQQLRSTQQQASVPVAAMAIQPDLLSMYQKLVDAYDQLAQAYSTGDAALLQLGLGKANEAESLSRSVRRALRDAAAPCGITVPSA